MESNIFSAEEIRIMQLLVDRSHTRNMETGKGSSREMTALLRKLNALNDEGQGNV